MIVPVVWNRAEPAVSDVANDTYFMVGSRNHYCFYSICGMLKYDSLGTIIVNLVPVVTTECLSSRCR